MNDLNPSRNPAARPSAGCFPILLLLAGLLTADARAGAVFTSLYSFTGTNDGANPHAGLVQGSDGNFYGTTGSGGTNNLGTVFKITSTGALSSLYSFTGGKDGGSPYAGLAQGSDGSFYGTTETGGTNGNNGTVFKITSTGALTSLYSFTGGRDGGLPIAGLVQASDGNFYGTTDAGGTNNLGTVFQISTNGALTSLYSFTGGSDGAYPLARLAQGSEGNLYGTTGGHGPFFYPCAVFKITSTGALISLYTFSAPWVESPSGLVQGSDGNLYGTTASGGRYSHGSVFNISTNGALTNLYSFTGTNDGAYPHAGLVQGSDGSFYGTTYGGGNTNLNYGQGYGTVYTVATNGTLTSLYSFGGTNDGAIPLGALVQGSDGNFYGTTSSGGTNNLGTVFRVTIEPQLTLTLSGANVILSWPTNYAGWYLQQNVNLGAAGFVRITLQGPPVIINGQFVVTLPRPSGQRLFCRLSLQ
jgi:uncharacterized repeat protein (TIGR03803 family)